MISAREDEIFSFFRSNQPPKPTKPLESPEKQSSLLSPDNLKYNDVTSYLMKKPSPNKKVEEEKSRTDIQQEIKEKMLLNEIQTLKDEVKALKTSIIGLEDKYDIDILVKTKAKRGKGNDKGLAE